GAGGPWAEGSWAAGSTGAGGPWAEGSWVLTRGGAEGGWAASGATGGTKLSTMASSPKCSASSALEMCLSTSASIRTGQPSWVNCSLLALRSWARSPASHSKMHADSLAIKMGYSWWASVVTPPARRRM
ncbi:hypothetical protein COCON_G00212240, partial [Conger conger]